MADWDAQFDAGTLLNNAPSRITNRSGGPSTSSSSSTRRAQPSALIDDDRDVSMAGPSEADDLQDIVEPHRKDETHLEQLMRHWMNERHAPDILDAQDDLLSSLLDHIRRQSEAVQLLRGEMSTSEEEHLRIMLVQTEVERVKFVVRSYIRTRLYKIEKYARHIVSNAEVQRRLTTSELEHARRFAKLTDQHFHHSVLQSLPESQSRLDDTPILSPTMINQPDRKRPVFVHALDDCPPIRFDDGTTLTMRKGHISLMPYSAAETLLSRGQVELV
ncbi:GINS complex subunit [Marasmius crinis-equi]|uniref:DNA replication complex GINS protein SLD5 n=1 Tax=Marasmius crinis-equi TaxID=585013 RepID=A0ABR3FMJ9_9AGAR